MSEPTTPDPAVSPPADGGFPLRGTWDGSDEERDGGFLAAVASKWWVVAAAVALALLAAILWCAAATPLYTSTVVFAVEHTRPPSAKDLPPDEFLAAQRELFLSEPVLAAAATPGTPPPVRQLRDQLAIHTDKGQGTMTVSLSAPRGEQAAMTLNALASAYLKAAGQQQQASADSLGDLSANRDRMEATRAAAEKALNDFRTSAKIAAGDADQAAASQLQQLKAALATAQADASKAKTEYDAAAPLLADPTKAEQLVASKRSSGIFDAIDQERAIIRKELDALEPTLAQQRQTLLPQHPALQQTQRKVDALTARLAEIDKQYPQAYRAYLEHQRDSAQHKADELKALVDEQENRSKTSTAQRDQLAQLEARLKEAEAALSEADKKLRGRISGSDASAAVMRLAQPPTVPTHPSSPDRARVMAMCGVGGMVAGLALALVLGKAR